MVPVTAPKEREQTPLVKAPRERGQTPLVKAPKEREQTPLVKDPKEQLEESTAPVRDPRALMAQLPRAPGVIHRSRAGRGPEPEAT